MIINGNLHLIGSNIETLGNVKEINGKLNLRGCYNLISLGDLEFIDGTLILSGCKNLKDLGKLRKFNSRYSIKLLESGISKEYIEEKKPWLKYVCDFNN